MTTDIIYRYKTRYILTSPINVHADALSASEIQRMPSVRHPISGLNRNLHWKRFTKPLMSLIFQTVMKWFSADTENRPWLLKILWQ